MKKKFLALTAGALLFSFMGVLSCSSDDNNSTSDPTDPVNPVEEIKIPTAAAFNDLRKSVLEREKQVFTTTVDENGIVSFTSKKGVKVEVGYLGVQGEFAQAGDEVTCTFIELYDKGTMALANRPTMGIYPNRDENGYFEVTRDEYGRISAEGYKGFIITGGEFYFDIQIKGKPVTNYGINMIVPAANTGGFQDDMLFWQGNLDENDDLTFTEIPMQTEMGMLEGDKANEAYRAYLNGWGNIRDEIGWTNIDKYAYLEGEAELTRFFVKAPTGYDYSNAAIYLMVKNEQGLAQLDDFVDHSNHGKVFTEHYGWVPVGLEGYLVLITVDPETYKVAYAVKEIKVVKDQLIEFKSEDLKTGGIDEVTTVLNTFR